MTEPQPPIDHSMRDRLMQYMDEEALEAQQIDLLKRQLARLATESDFYQDRLKDFDIAAMGSLEDLAALPFTSKDDLRSSQEERPPLGLHAGVPRERVSRISSTSGTTGRALYYALTEGDVRGVWNSWINMYEAAGLSPEDVALFVFAMGGPYGTLYGAEAIEQFGLTGVPCGSEQASERIIRLLRDLSPSVLLCISNFATLLAGKLLDQGLDPAETGVRKLLLGGEPAAPVRAEAEALWQAEVYEMMGIGEVGMIWGECPHHGGMHYLSKGLVLPEFLDPETLKPVRPGPGDTLELAYTHLDREACALVRYRARDLVRVDHVSCECGRRGPRITCVGRSDDMIKVRGVNLFPTAIADTLSGFGEPVTNNFKIVLVNGERKFSRPLSLVVGVRELPAEPERDRLAARLADFCRERLNVRTEIDLRHVSELGDTRRGGQARTGYFIDG